jgi:arylsulfatase A-like enzyme
MRRPLTRRDFLKVAALAPLLGLAVRQLPAAARQAPAPNRPNVVVIVFDTLSAKHMSLYGYPRQTTPNLERFAKRATVFHQHYAGGNFTSPGTSSLLTAAYPWTQRCFNFQSTVTKEYEQKSLFQVFDTAGYYRVAYTHNWLVVQLLNQFRGDISYWKPMRELCLTDTEFSDRLFPNDHDVAYSTERMMLVRNPTGTGSLFLSVLGNILESNDQNKLLEKYKPLFPRGLPTNNETMLFVLEEAIDWIQSELQQAPRPFLGYFHLLPPHEPYNTRREFIGRFDHDGVVEVPKPLHPLSATSFDEPQEGIFRRHYDEYVAYADAEFGRLYDFMEQAGLFDTTYVVFTSDHGQILERGTRGHLNPLLYESIVRIPLIISSPGQTQRVNVRTPTSCVDVLPTLAHLIGQPLPAWSEGTLLPTLGGQVQPERSVFTVEAKSNAKQAPLTEATVSMVKDQYKLIHYRGYGKGYDNFFELYDLKNDPEELMNVYSADRSRAAALQGELLAKLDEVNRPYRHT